jgi:hypothetical protein
MTFYELALIILCPFPAILFSLSASYNLIIFYELALLSKLNSDKIWKMKWWQTFVRNVIIEINNM